MRNHSALLVSRVQQDELTRDLFEQVHAGIFCQGDGVASWNWRACCVHWVLHAAHKGIWDSWRWIVEVRWLWRKAESHRCTPTYSYRATSRDESGATSEDLHPTSLFLVIASAEYREAELFPLICFK